MTMKRSLGFTLLVAGTVVLAACRQDPEPLPPAANTVADVLAAEGFTTLGTALEAAGLDETLAGEGTFTVFAPTDEAFAALPEGALNDLLTDTAALTELLEYHVLTETVSAGDLGAAGADFRTTL